jgi:anti-sigma regulatory factor (Ser/Thr protein kinase)
MRKLSVPAALESLEKIGAYVVRAAAEAGLDARGAYNLRLAVDEIATNIISYGYGAGEGGDLTLKVELTPASLTIVLEDRGIPFDPLAREAVNEEDLALPLEERQIGGLGIYLVLKGVDAFRYEYGDGVNRNIFEMKLAPTPAPA